MMKSKLNAGNCFISLMITCCLIFFVNGCGAPTTVADLTPATVMPGERIQKIKGSVSVQASVPRTTTSPTYVPMDVSHWIDSIKLKQAIENTIVQHQIFSEVSPEQADYLLEVWVDKIQNMLEITGEGFIYDLTSVWRLTRTKDGKIVACEFVKGHGASHAMASNAYPPSISAATQEIIQKGLFAISDQSQSHLSALSTAENRPAITPKN